MDDVLVAVLYWVFFLFALLLLIYLIHYLYEHARLGNRSSTMEEEALPPEHRLLGPSGYTTNKQSHEDWRVYFNSVLAEVLRRTKGLYWHSKLQSEEENSWLGVLHFRDHTNYWTLEYKEELLQRGTKRDNRIRLADAEAARWCSVCRAFKQREDSQSKVIPGISKT